MLSIDSIDVFYGAIHALKGISLDIGEGEIFTVIGANGAGKTTLLRTIMGLERCAKGTVNFLGKDITAKPTYLRARMGMTLVPQERGLFPDFPVIRNLLLGAYRRKGEREVEQDIQHVFDMFPILKERANQTAKTLSGGEQQMLAIGRAMMSKPNLMLLDEPSMGLMPTMVTETFNAIKELKERTTILLVEQNARKALAIADRAAVLELGKVVLHGNAEQLTDDPMVKRAYLGG
jgi:branched-chain amino acid transport system ATP-binding protein